MSINRSYYVVHFSRSVNSLEINKILNTFYNYTQKKLQYRGYDAADTEYKSVMFHGLDKRNVLFFAGIVAVITGYTVIKNEFGDKVA